MTWMLTTASLWIVAVRYPEIERGYLAMILLITVSYCVLIARIGPRLERLSPVSSPELRRLNQLQVRFGLGMYVATITLPAILIALGLLPFSAILPGFWILIISNSLSILWFGRRIKTANKALVAGLTPGPLPAGMSERVGALVLDGDLGPAMAAYRMENPGTSANHAREAIYGYLSTRIESRDAQPAAIA